MLAHGVNEMHTSSIRLADGHPPPTAALRRPAARAAGGGAHRPLHHRGAALGLNHTTVARNITALERALGGRVLVRGADGWALTALGGARRGPARRVAESLDRLAGRRAGRPRHRRRADDDDRRVRRLHRLARDGRVAPRAPRAVGRARHRHPVATQHRSGVDIDVVVGEPACSAAGRAPRRVRARHVRLARLPGAPRRTRHVEEMSRHRLVYFVDSMLQVNDLDTPAASLPGMPRRGHLDERVRARRGDPGRGRSRVPALLHGRPAPRPGPDAPTRHHRAAALLGGGPQPESWRRPAVAAVVGGLRKQMDEQRGALIGR